MTIDIDEIFKHLTLCDREMLMAAMESGYTDKYVEWTPGRFVGVNITQPGFQIDHRVGCWVEGLLTGHTIPFPVMYSPFAPFEGFG